MTSIGQGVREIRIREPSGAFRVIYIVQTGNALHVLHCFRKTTQKTGLHDLRLARDRLKQLEVES